MKSCFNSPFKITQKFGDDWLDEKTGKLYYSQYGWRGHNGLDLVPTGENKIVFNIFTGVILFLGVDGDYGNRVKIWNRELKLCEYYNHLEFIDSRLKVGMVLGTSGNFIGKMGSTGKTIGAHVHYEICLSDNKGNRINKNNGYGGYIDPLPYLKD